MRVARVKSGVAPDFVAGREMQMIRHAWYSRLSHDGFGRDARNDRRDACSTRPVS
jgi:hypothetical protein